MPMTMNANLSPLGFDHHLQLEGSPHTIGTSALISQNDQKWRFRMFALSIEMMKEASEPADLLKESITLSDAHQDYR